MFPLNDEYQGYALDVCIWDLTDKEKFMLEVVCYYVDNRCTVREVARNMGISKSTVSTYINLSRKLSYELYSCAKKIAKEHRICV